MVFFCYRHYNSSVKTPLGFDQFRQISLLIRPWEYILIAQNYCYKALYGGDGFSPIIPGLFGSGVPYFYAYGRYHFRKAY